MLHLVPDLVRLSKDFQAWFLAEWGLFSRDCLPPSFIECWKIKIQKKTTNVLSPKTIRRIIFLFRECWYPSVSAGWLLQAQPVYGTWNNIQDKTSLIRWHCRLSFCDSQGRSGTCISPIENIGYSMCRHIEGNYSCEIKHSSKYI